MDDSDLSPVAADGAGDPLGSWISGALAALPPSPTVPRRMRRTQGRRRPPTHAGRRARAMSRYCQLHALGRQRVHVPPRLLDALFTTARRTPITPAGLTASKATRRYGSRRTARSTTSGGGSDDPPGERDPWPIVARDGGRS